MNTPAAENNPVADVNRMPKKVQICAYMALSIGNFRLRVEGWLQRQIDLFVVCAKA